MNEKTGGLTPYGYDNAAGKLILNAKEQQVIRKILRLRKHGNSYSGISSILNARRVKTKTGCRWYAQTVKNVISARKEG